MRKIIMTDIHGMFDVFKKALNDLQYDEEVDQLILLGDYLDRGPDSFSTVDYIMKLQQRANVIALMGNHEDMANDRRSSYGKSLWYSNGGQDTVDSYKSKGIDIEEHQDWLMNLPLFHEDDDFFFCHAGIDVERPLNRQKRSDLLWIREEFYANPKKLPKKVVFGHTPLRGGHAIFPNGAIGIDGGAYFSKTLTGLVINEKGEKEFYSSNMDSFRRVVENRI